MENQNPLLRTLRLPGETVVLPSKALFYKNGEVADDVIKQGGEIYVQPMTTYEEILMKTPDLLFTGQAIVQALARCIPQVYNPLELLAADIDFLLMALRKVSFGSQVVVTYDHNCSETSKSHEYSVSITKFIKEAKYVDPATVVNSFEHTLPNGQTVEMQPFRLKDVLDISQIAVNEPTSDDTTDLDRAQFLANLLTAGTIPAIKSVTADGEKIINREQISEWVRSLPVLWVKELSDVIESANKWGVSSAVEVACKDCGESMSVQVPLNPQSFFTLPSDLEILN
jgi:hypothetical protein